MIKNHVELKINKHIQPVMFILHNKNALY